MPSKQIACPECGKRVRTIGGYLHWKAVHQDAPWATFHEAFKNALTARGTAKAVAAATTNGHSNRPIPEKARAKPLVTNGKAPPSMRPNSFEFGAITTVVPHSFQIASALLWQAKFITEHEWGWPEQDPGPWLDTYLHRTMHALGFIIGGYVPVDENDHVIYPTRHIAVEEGTSAEEDDGEDAGDDEEAEEEEVTTGE